MKKEAVDYYHSLLNDQVAAETQASLDDLLRSKKLYFGGRAVCTVLRPHFYTPDQFAYLKQETEILLQAFSKAHAAAMKDVKIREKFFLRPWEEEMMQLHPPEQTPWSTSRLDSFFSLEHGTLQFVEYNAETPAGIGYEDVLAEAFLELPVMKMFQEKFSTRSLAVRHHLFDALMETYQQWLGRKPDRKPNIAIADWDDVPTKNEHHLLKEWFEAHGAPSVLVNPRDLEYRDGKLWANDFRVDLIYKRVLGLELYEQLGPDSGIFQALRERAVCISNSFQALLLYKKCSLAFLSDETNRNLFTSHEGRAIAEHIPWTRIVSERKTLYKGQTMDLMQIIADNRESLVLKPNDAYGGKGVVLGWDANEQEWEQAIKTALTEPYVVQEKVNIASEYFPYFAEGHLRKSKLFVDANPFIFMGSVTHGVLTRLSSAALLNVTAGHGSTVPSFIVEKR
ncbi:circularly permuted type 2 ATP-grasp protein [bacterium]|nr:circularly permuted type 2 ATP-grasp protein [bacterium]MCI0605404.1 circularly permuted type 2 ATP-grasp protein [bacterium]